MHQFNDIWNAATFKRSSCRGGCILVIVGLISMIFGDNTDTEMMLCTDDSMPCVLTYGETMNVCDGDRAYANMTLRVNANMISPNDITIMVLDQQFSKGSVLSGQFHNGDERIDRWTNKISFQGNTMTYEIWNLQTESGDEFECHMEIIIEGEKFISKHFKWFFVDSCTTKPSNIKDTTEQYLDILDNNTEQLDQLRASMNSLASDMAEQKKMNIHLIQLANNITEGSIERAVKYSDQFSEMLKGLENVKTKLDTQNNRLDTSNKMDIAQIVVLVLVLIISFLITAKIYIPPRVQKDLQDKFSGLLNRIGCNQLQPSSTFDHSTVRSQSSSSLASMNQDEPSPNKEAKPLLQEDTETLTNLIPFDHSTVCSQSSASMNQDEPSPSLASNNPQFSITDERSTPSNLTVFSPRVRSQSMLSVPPEDEVQEETETTDV